MALHIHIHTKDARWGSWKEWNDEYTKLLQKRNKAEREVGAAKSPELRTRAQAKLSAANNAAEAHRSHPERQNSTATKNFVR